MSVKRCSGKCGRLAFGEFDTCCAQCGETSGEKHGALCEEVDKGHTVSACSSNCGRLASVGFSSCCKLCASSGGSEHGAICESVYKLRNKLMDEGKNLGTRLDFAPVHDLNEGVDFESNKAWLAQCMQLLQTKADFKSIHDICGPPDDELVQYVRSLQPVHRASQTVFKAIMRDGGLRSRHLQAEMRGKSPVDAACMRVRTHPQMGALLKKHSVRKRNVGLFIDVMRPMLELRLSKVADGTGIDDDGYNQISSDRKNQIEANLKERLERLTDKIGTDEDSDETIADMNSLADSIGEHARTSRSDDTGIGYSRDEELGTDKHVFSVIGANLGDAYGPIVLILGPRIMRHPDFNMTITAATSYVSKRTYFHRPWAALGQLINYQPVKRTATFGSHTREAEDEVEPSSSSTDIDCSDATAVKVMREGVAVEFSFEEMIDTFQKSKLHPCTVDWEYFVAQDLALQARLFFMSKRSTDGWIDKWTADYRTKFIEDNLDGEEPKAEDITCRIVKNWYTRINSHGCIEGHLPAFVPLDCVETILMPQHIFEEMKDELEAYKMSDGKPLISRVVPLDDTGDYCKEARIWQVDFFNRRANYVKRDEDGAKTDVRAFSFGVEDLKGEDLFLPLRLLNPAAGFTLRFRAKGQHIRLAFTNRRENTRDKDADGDFHVYFVAIGAFKNTVTFMKRSNKRGQPTEVKLERASRPDAMAFPDRYRDYWITYDASSGVFRLGHGSKDKMELEDTCLFQWTDPKPHQDLEYASVSCWETPIDFATLKVSDALRSNPCNVEDMFKRLDMDSDGSISLGQLLELLPQSSPLIWHADKVKEFYAAATGDDGDGLTVKALKSWMRKDEDEWKEHKDILRAIPAVGMLGWGLAPVTLPSELEVLQEMLRVYDPDKLGSGRQSSVWASAHGNYSSLKLRLAWKMHLPNKFKSYEANRKHVKGEIAFLGYLDDGNLKDEMKVLTKLDDLNEKFHADSAVNEKFLLHGTKPESVLTIMHNGLSERFSGGLFGHGVYMAEDAEKIDQYTTPDDGELSRLETLREKIFVNGMKHPGKDLFYVFVVRACLGIAVETSDGEISSKEPHQDVFNDSSKRELSAIPDSDPAIPYHALIGEHGASLHRELLTFNGDRTVLEYLLAYSREA